MFLGSSFFLPKIPTSKPFKNTCVTLIYYWVNESWIWGFGFSRAACVTTATIISDTSSGSSLAHVHVRNPQKPAEHLPFPLSPAALDHFKMRCNNLPAFLRPSPTKPPLGLARLPLRVVFCSCCSQNRWYLLSGCAVGNSVYLFPIWHTSPNSLSTEGLTGYCSPQLLVTFLCS